MYLSSGYMVRLPHKAKTPLVREVEKIMRWQCSGVSGCYTPHPIITTTQGYNGYGTK
jgi:hypothetical protein